MNSLERVSLQSNGLSSYEKNAVSCDKGDVWLQTGKTPLSFCSVLCLLDISGNLRKKMHDLAFLGVQH